MELSGGRITFFFFFLGWGMRIECSSTVLCQPWRLKLCPVQKISKIVQNILEVNSVLRNMSILLNFFQQRYCKSFVYDCRCVSVFLNLCLPPRNPNARLVQLRACVGQATGMCILLFRLNVPVRRQLQYMYNCTSTYHTVLCPGSLFQEAVFYIKIRLTLVYLETIFGWLDTTYMNSS